MTISFFPSSYVGMEYCYGTYLTTFAVKSSVDAGRREGARATAIFWGSFSLMRFLAIFASSARVRPVRVLVLSFAICLVFFSKYTYNKKFVFHPFLSK